MLSKEQCFQSPVVGRRASVCDRVQGSATVKDERVHRLLVVRDNG